MKYWAGIFVSLMTTMGVAAFLRSSSLTLPTRELIIILDSLQEEQVNLSLSSSGTYTESNYPQGLGAMTYTLLIALDQEVAPILASGSLLKNIHDHYRIYYEFATRSLEELTHKYAVYTRFSLPGACAEFKQHAEYIFKHAADLKSYLHDYKVKDSPAVASFLATHSPFQPKHAPQTLVLTEQTMSRTRVQEMSNYLLCAQAIETLKKYTLQQLDNDLYILVPLRYREQLGLSKKINKQQKNFCASQAENTVGLAVEHLVTVSLEEIAQRNFKPLADIRHALRRLFVSGQRSHKWLIYMTGHGKIQATFDETIAHLKHLDGWFAHQAAGSRSAYRLRERLRSHYTSLETLQEQAEHDEYEGMIAGLSVHNFRNFLLFLDKEISTHAFYYASCYSGGKHLRLPYTTNQGNPVRLSYTVMAGCVGENLAEQEIPYYMLPPYRLSYGHLWGIEPEGLDLKKGFLKLITTLRFDKFFKKLQKSVLDTGFGNSGLTSHGVQDTDKMLYGLVSCLHPYADKQGHIMDTYLGNIPHIRPAGHAAFRVIGGNPYVTVLSQYAGRYAKVSTAEAILLESQHVDRIRINRSHFFPSIISLKAGPASYIFDCIEAAGATLQEVIDGFLVFPEQRSPKLFWIKKLTCMAESPFKLNQIDSNLSTITLHDVIIMRNGCLSYRLPSLNSLKKGTVTPGAYANTHVYVTRLGSTPLFFEVIMGKDLTLKERPIEYREELAFYRDFLLQQPESYLLTGN
jgi:hypothetical protein